MKRSFHKISRLPLVLALALVMMVTAALPTFAAPTAQEEFTEVALGDVVADPATFAEQPVLVNGEIVGLDISPNLAVLRSADRFGLDRLGVIGDQALFQDLTEADAVDVTGTVRIFDADLQSELGFEFDEETVATFEGRPVVVAEEITSVGEAAAAAGVVARVGEREITQEEFDERFEDVVRTVAARRGIPLNQETAQLFEGLRSQYLRRLATEEALLTEAETRGISVTDEELTGLVDQVRQQFPDDETFQEALTEAGFADEDEFQSFVERNEILRRTMEALGAEIEVTDEEILQFYDTNQEVFVDSEGETVPFEDVEPRIRTRLEQQELQQRVTEIAEAEGIEVFPENLSPLSAFGEMEGEEEVEE